jgi:uncharacterized protein YbjT (DUF2867 family)
VIGATGNIGSKAAERLLGEGRKVRAVARSREKLAALASKGAEIAAGTVEDPAFLVKAFTGAEAVLAMVPTNLQAQDVGAYQDRVSSAIAQALRDTGVKKVVDISSMGAQTEAGSGIVAGLARHEKRLDALPGVDVLHLRPGYFMENFLGSVGMVKGMGILGSAIRPDAPVHLIATADIAKYASERLLKGDFKGKAVQELLGPRDMTMKEAAAILGKAIGKPDLPYVQFPYAEAAKAMVGAGLSPSVADSFIVLQRSMNENQVFRSARRDAGSTTSTRLEDFAPVFAAVYATAGATVGETA